MLSMGRRRLGEKASDAAPKPKMLAMKSGSEEPADEEIED
jgi:hypothetical protein